jgi:inosose dehydratase
MRKHRERVSYLHLKSVDAALERQVNREGLRFAQAMEMGVFCEPEKGVVDFKALSSLLKEIEFDGYAIVEQDMPPQPLDRPLPVARRTLAYLREVGIA